MLRYVSHFAEQWVSDIGIVISRYTSTIYSVYLYRDITWARAWLGTINRPRRDVIAIFGRLIGSLLESQEGVRGVDVIELRYRPLSLTDSLNFAL